MYNRYIPQGDGSYRRRPVAEMPKAPVPPPPPSEERPPVCPVPPPQCESCPNRPGKRREAPKSQSGFQFLRELLPGNFDAEDLLVVILLLLMSGESREDRNLPLLTLALYLFL